MKMEFQQPANGHIEEVDGAWFYTLIFGCFYLGYKGAWGAAVLAFFAAVFTAGLSWLILPVFADEILRKSYLRRGWTEITSSDAKPKMDAPKPKRSAKEEAEHQRKLAEAKRKMGW